MQYFLEGRELAVESPQEGFYIRTLNDGSRELRLWEVHAGTRVENREESQNWVGVVVAGEIEFQFEDAKKNLFPTDVVWIPARTKYTFRAVGEKAARLFFVRS